MAEPPKEGQLFRSYDEFDSFLKDYAARTAQTFVVNDSKKTEKANEKSSQEKQFPASLKYRFLKLTCVKFGSS